MDEVVLVTPEDEIIGEMEKMEAHRQGALHRAFSVFIFNDEGKMLIHRRALEKYHSGGLWTNACCSHPRPGESVADAASRRLIEEMGFSTPLEEIYSFIYRAELDNDLIEHELDHVLFGRYNASPSINKSEVAEWKYVSIPELESEIEQNGNDFTVWFKIIFDAVKDRLPQ